MLDLPLKISLHCNAAFMSQKYNCNLRTLITDTSSIPALLSTQYRSSFVITIEIQLPNSA